MSMDVLVSLGAIDDVTYVGGKAAALSRMIQAGYQIPDGFVVTTASNMVMSPELEAQILSRFDSLGTDMVAVRSSAVGEDGAHAAWAGQLDTYLNTTRSKLIATIEACWQSTNSPRALSYAEQQGINRTDVAVLIQAMVQSEVSGVAFSVHPVTNNSDTIVIEAGLGLGEAIVSGEITPDSYCVQKSTGLITERYISSQTKQLRRSHTGETTWEPTDATGADQKLSDELVQKLAATVAKLEQDFGYPVDVEWAVAKNTTYILQCRPITTTTDS